MKKRAQGFSLIEMIGTIAILAILASAIAPTLVSSIKRSKAKAEVESLDAISDALVSFISENGIIPSTSDWGDSISSRLAVPSSEIYTIGNGTRRMVIDPRFTNTYNLPYNQTTEFNNNTLPTSKPKARIMIVSNFSEAVPTRRIRRRAFDSLWVKPAPANSINGFDENKMEITIKRIAAQELFHLCILNISGNGARWATNSSNRLPLANGSVYNYYLIDGTKIRLSDASGLQKEVIIHNDITLDYSLTNRWTVQ